jgi:hypothetical protein
MGGKPNGNIQIIHCLHTDRFTGRNPQPVRSDLTILFWRFKTPSVKQEGEQIETHKNTNTYLLKNTPHFTEGERNKLNPKNNNSKNRLSKKEGGKSNNFIKCASRHPRVNPKKPNENKF